MVCCNLELGFVTKASGEQKSATEDTNLAGNWSAWMQAKRETADLFGAPKLGHNDDDDGPKV